MALAAVAGPSVRRQENGGSAGRLPASISGTSAILRLAYGISCWIEHAGPLTAAAALRGNMTTELTSADPDKRHYRCL
jgi:hypothetical protein